MSDVQRPDMPDDLVSIGEAARALGMSYSKLWYHVERQHLARWARAGNRLVSMSEVRAFIEKFYQVRPVERGGRDDEGNGEE